VSVIGASRGAEVTHMRGALKEGGHISSVLELVAVSHRVVPQPDIGPLMGPLMGPLHNQIQPVMGPPYKLMQRMMGQPLHNQM
jgi:hypothetical protein